MEQFNLNRALLWGTAVVLVVGTGIFFALYSLDPKSPLPWILVAAIGCVWACVAILMLIMQIFLYKPWTERERLLAELSAQNRLYAEMFAVTRRVGHAASEAATVERGMQAAVETLREELKLDGCSLRMLDEKKNQLISVAGVGYRNPSVKPVPLAANQGIAGKAIAERRSIFIADTSQEKEFVSPTGSSAPIRSLFCVPLIEQGTIVGVLSGSCSTPRNFAPHERDVLDLISARLAALLYQYRTIQATTAGPVA